MRWLRVRELADVAAGKFADSPLDRARDCLTRAVQISETLDAHEFLKLATCAKVSPHPPPVVITDIPKPRPPRERNPEQTEPSTPTDAMTVQRSHPIMPESRLWPPRRIIEIFGGILSFFKGVFGILASGWLRLVIACWEQVATIRGAEETAADQPEEVAARMENRAVAISVAMISTVLVLIAAFFFWRLGMRMATPSGTRESSGRACR